MGQRIADQGGQVMAVVPKINVGDNYKEQYGFFDPEKYVFKAKRGLSPEVVKEISWMKSEPAWMTKFRLHALEIYYKRPLPTWGADLFKEYFGTIIPPGDNKFAALNSAVWSGGSFIYIPKGVKVEIPLQAYFRINAQNMGQFERTLIICDEDSFVHYIEGCTAPVYSSDSLHSAVVEIVVKRG